MVSALRRAVRWRQAMRERDLRLGTSGCARAPVQECREATSPPERGLTARELIRMAQAARRGPHPASPPEA
ncbi:hypothetical protein [Methylobacterium oxalidis]|uniref:Uncharacterized protein n=1 Tax=Methylobacterium oxalidis TaxID=944322 RepID=A0A512J595_9HYPH|nr:hypothetical protein [Methylobacterium oxalidis]GEP05141.1 hypothetical protein MOX02_31790 [Methylobacterium oxalidis]GJE31790.1 hypothetical protein LDDCCGHA_1970 [Methylobacterium oxalidis]GLS62567.1 hypothetical protein GCM10007888_09480 [Methylobacterium oxalidis]